jgi:predicted dehydrogenase
MLGYAEELCFAPKYIRLKQLVDEGALGRVHLVKQSEKHDGPHAPWFFDTRRSGGGVTMDMGCHAVEFFRWMLGRDRQKAQMIALCDAMVQSTELSGEVETKVIGPLRAAMIADRNRKAAETAATRVDFYTMVRGEG